MYQRTAKGKNSVGLAVFALSLLLAQARHASHREDS